MSIKNLFKAYLIIGGVLLLSVSGKAGLNLQRITGSEPEFATNRIIIKVKENVHNNQLAGMHAKMKAKIKREFKRFKRLQVLELSDGQDPRKAVAAYEKSGLVDYAELDYRVQASAIPNDQLFATYQWEMNNTGQGGGVPGVDIKAPAAWDIRNDAGNVIVATVDSGARLDHEDLVNRLWTNPGEIPGNGKDDDGDGYVDDVHGISSVNGVTSGDPSDDNGHGTHVAGIIGAEGNNGKGICGMAWNVQIMPLKFLNSNGAGYTSDAITCLDYAAVHGASIINNSWGGHMYEQSLYDAINELRSEGIIFVAAAGNDGIDSDEEFTYPACYWLDNIVSVASMNNLGQLSWFSTYGDDSVAIAAPGEAIASTWNAATNSYALLSGTSMATPHVTGALALLKAACPNDSYLALINRLLASVDQSANYQGKTISGGSLNLLKALQTATQVSPPNDEFASRYITSGPNVTVFGNNLGGTKEMGEPNHAGNAGGKSIWWQWEPMSPGLYEITTAKSVTTNGSSMDTLLGVYTGTSVDALTTIASDDDDMVTGDGTVCSRVVFNAALNTKYQIAVDGKNGEEGFVKLTVRPVPRNDDLANALRINGRYIGVEGANWGATKESNEPNHGGNAGGRSVWWTWVAPCDGQVALSTAGSDFDTTLAVYTGNAYPLTLVAQNDDFTDVKLNDGYGGKTSYLTFTASCGQEYQIAVDGADGACGHIKLAGGYMYSLNSPTQVRGQAQRINKINQVAGTYIQDSPPLGYLLADTLNVIGTGASGGAVAYGLNNLGQVAGGLNGKPMIWDPVNGFTMLQPVVPQQHASYATAINDNGVVAGYGLDAWNNLDPAYWIGTNIVTLYEGQDNRNQMNGEWGVVEDINSHNEMAGWADSDDYVYEYPFYAVAGDPNQQVHDLPIFTGVVGDGFKINDGGEVIGLVDTSGGNQTLGALWFDGRLQVLGSPGPGNICYLLSGDSKHQIVGQYDWPGSLDPVIARACLWQNGVFMDLNRLATFVPEGDYYWDWLGQGADINQNGIIVGIGQVQGPSGPYYGSFIMTPTLGVRLENSGFNESDQFGFDLTGPAGQTCVVQATTDLLSSNWTTVLTCSMPSNGITNIVDTDSSTLNVRFYRAMVGNIRSDDGVGYYRRTLAPGWNGVGYPFVAQDNRIPALLAGAPQDLVVQKWDEKAQEYVANTNSASGWGNTQMTLRPGEGALLWTSTGFSWECFGEIEQNCVSSSVSTNIVFESSPIPIAGQVDTTLQFPVSKKDSIYTWNTAGNVWNTADVYSAGGWSATPTIALGEAFVSLKYKQPMTWLQNYSIW